MSGTLTDRAAALLAGIGAGEDRPRRIGRLAAFDGLMMEATGFDRPVGSGARVITADGRAARAEVVGFRGMRTLLMALDGDGAHTNGARVEPDAAGGCVAVGPALLGRVVDAMGAPLDGLGTIACAERWPLAGRPGNPLDRARVTAPFDIGVRAVNALLTVGVGQRVAIVAGSGVGKSVLMGQMIAGAEAEVIVVGLIGERSREVSDFLATKLPPAVRRKAVVVAVPADHAPLLRLRAAMRATAIAEYFRAQGRKVLLLIDSLTRVAHAQREIGLSLGEPPTVKGYPPSALGLIPRLVERAGADATTGGAITALYTVLADGDDTDDPIVDAARAIVDGHILLSRGPSSTFGLSFEAEVRDGRVRINGGRRRRRGNRVDRGRLAGRARRRRVSIRAAPRSTGFGETRRRRAITRRPAAEPRRRASPPRRACGCGGAREGDCRTSPEPSRRRPRRPSRDRRTGAPHARARSLKLCCPRSFLRRHEGEPHGQLDQLQLGIGSGIDIKSLVESLAEADRGPKEALIKRREEANAARISALAEASSAIDGFASALSGLISGGSLFTQPSVSDPALVGASALPGARLANLAADLEVVQLAKAQTLQSAQLGGEAAAVGQGDLTLVTAAGRFTVTVDAGNDSLTGLAAAINGKNAGVVASVVTDGTSARLVLKGATGAAHAFSLEVPAGTASGLERFAFDAGATGGLSVAQVAQDAIVRLDGVEVRRSSNSIKDLVPGVQIDLKRAAPGATVALGITRPGAAIEQGVADFVSAFNELNSLLAKATAAGDEGSDSGALRGDVSIRELQRRLRELPSLRLTSQGGIRSLAEIGVATNRDGSLSLNSVRLKAALIEDPVGVEALFNPTQYASSPLLSITTAMGRAKPGTYTFTNVVPGTAGADASGLIDGVAATGSGNFLIAPGNSAAVGLAVEVKGAFASATVTIDPGLGGALQAIRDALRARSGPIATSRDRLTQEKAEIADDRAKMETRASAYRGKLLTQFMAMERRVSAFKATQTYLEQQIKAWTGGND